MEDQRKAFISWVKAHKKQLIVAGISVVVIIGIILGIKNRNDIKDLFDFLEKKIAKAPAKMPEFKTTKAVFTTKMRDTVADIIPMSEITAVRSYTPSQVSFDVSDHIRNLPKGWHASAKKIIEAAAREIILQPGQTLVDAYTKGSVAA